MESIKLFGRKHEYNTDLLCGQSALIDSYHLVEQNFIFYLIFIQKTTE